MTKVPTDLKYTSEHEWVKIVSESRVVVGITDYAQSKLGDVVFVDLPSLDENFEARAVIATIESIKAVSEIYAPITGMVTAKNDKLEHSPEFVNQDPYGEGWMLEIEPSAPAELKKLLSPAEYAALIGETK